MHGNWKLNLDGNQHSRPTQHPESQDRHLRKTILLCVSYFYFGESSWSSGYIACLLIKLVRVQVRLAANI